MSQTTSYHSDEVTSAETITEPKPSVYLGKAIILLGCLFYTLGGMCVRHDTYTSGWMFIFIRNCISIPIITLLVLRADLPLWPSQYTSKERFIIFIVAISTQMCAFFYVASLNYLPLSTCVPLVDITPCYAYILGLFFGTSSMSVQGTIASVASVLGVFLVSQPEFLFDPVDEPFNIKGYIYAILSGLLLGLLTVISCKYGKSLNSFYFTFYQVMFGMLMTGPVFALVPDSMTWPPSLAQALPVFAYSVLSTSAQILIFYGFTMETQVVASVLTTSDTVFGVVMGAAILEEVLNIWNILGSVLVLMSSILLTYTEAQSAQATQPEALDHNVIDEDDSETRGFSVSGTNMNRYMYSDDRALEMETMEQDNYEADLARKGWSSNNQMSSYSYPN